MQQIRDDLLAEARRRDFAAIGICHPDAVPKTGTRLRQWLAEGAHGEMEWMQNRASWRSAPRALWPDVESVVMLADIYRAPSPQPASPQQGVVAAYARVPDYHETLKKRIKSLGRWLQQRGGGDIKVFVDTAPVMEKPLAEAAGIGWQGKHTNLVSTELGSWFVLGAIFSTLGLPADERHVDRCGSCRRCLDICPTAAFTAPYKLDARRCISYLTIELKTAIPRPFRALIGNRVFGCDDCLAVCPWNRFAAAAAAHSHEATDLASLRQLARLDDAAFRAHFRGSPLRRMGRNRLLRNVLIALGNSGNEASLAEIKKALGDPSPLVRGAAVWALGRLAQRDQFDELMGQHLPAEEDVKTREEWKWADAQLPR